jgi:hypothetical protein
MLKRCDAFTRFLNGNCIGLTDNAAECALSCIPVRRNAWLFCGSDRVGQCAAVTYTLTQSEFSTFLGARYRRT